MDMCVANNRCNDNGVKGLWDLWSNIYDVSVFAVLDFL